MNLSCLMPWNLLNQVIYTDLGLSACPVSTPGIVVDDLIMQLVGLRYTEPDMTISYPGFLYLLTKLESMISKGGMVLDIRGKKGSKWNL